MRSRYLQSGGTHPFWSLLLYFFFFFKRAPTIIERVKISFPSYRQQTSTTFKRNKLPFQRFPPITSPPISFQTKNEVYEHHIRLGCHSWKCRRRRRRHRAKHCGLCLRAKLAEREVSTKTASRSLRGQGKYILSTPYRHLTTDTFDPNAV